MATAELAERMPERLASRGETMADVVVIQGDRKGTLRLRELLGRPRARGAVQRRAELVAAGAGLGRDEVRGKIITLKGAYS
jgi:hypothetical protein